MKVVKSVSIDAEIVTEIEKLEDREYRRFNLSNLVNTLLKKWVKENTASQVEDK